MTSISIHEIRNALVIIEGNTIYMQELGFAPKSCDAVLKGVERIVNTLSELEEKEKEGVE